MRICNLDGQSFHSDLVVVDFNPHSRTIMYCGDECYDSEQFVHIQMPYLRFAVGAYLRYAEPTSLPVWDGELWLWGSLEPFGDKSSLGFRMPLPNIDLSGHLSCIGTMERPQGKDLETLATKVIDNFWTSLFSHYAIGVSVNLPRIASTDYFHIKDLKGKEQEVYSQLKVVQGSLE